MAESKLFAQATHWLERAEKPGGCRIRSGWELAKIVCWLRTDNGARDVESEKPAHGPPVSIGTSAIGITDVKRGHVVDSTIKPSEKKGGVTSLANTKTHRT